LRHAAGRGRLPHTLLLHGGTAAELEARALELARALLSAEFAGPVGQHPELFVLRPVGKMRLIKVGDAGGAESNTVREFTRRAAMAALVGERKVGLLLEADRLNDASANALLKTLEEPPAGTFFLLTTELPRLVLPTIRSRCVQVALGSGPAAAPAPALAAWLQALAAWLDGVDGAGASDPAARLLGVYGLVSRVGVVLEEVAAAGVTGAEGLEEAERKAVEQALVLRVRQDLFAGIVGVVVARSRGAAGTARETDVRRKAVASSEVVAEAQGLVRYNLATESAVEFTLLRLLRIWAPKG
jgi:DNA polymerase-3 subunit delta'